MSQTRWDLPEVEDDDQTWPEQPSPTLVSLHFIRSALRRRWFVCALSAILGLLLAVGFLVVFHPHRAKATLALVHAEGADPSLAMSTDVGLLRSQAVAAKTIARLGLSMTPDGLLNSVMVEQVSTDLLSITIAAPTDEEAVRRLTTLTSIYLGFRGEQLSMQSDVYVAAMQQRVQKLDDERTALSRRVDQLSNASGSEAGKLSETIAQRAFVQSQIDDLHQSIEDASLRNSSVVAASRVIDPAAVEPGGGKRRMVLVLVSGLIGGAAVGCGIVLFLAITSDRLRRRSDIADAVDAPVRVSVRRIAPISKRWLWVPHMSTLDGGRADDRHRLAHALEMELPVPRERGRLAVACIDNADEVIFAVADAAIDLATDGHSVALLDLTTQGSLNIKLMSRLAASAAQPTLLRPHVIPELAGAEDLRVVGQEQQKTPALELYDAVLVLANLDPSVGADHLTAWTDRVIFVATSGRSSAERLRTAADLVRTAGLDLRFVVLLHAEPTDDSTGRSTSQIEQADTESANHKEQRLAEGQPVVDVAGTTQLEAGTVNWRAPDVQVQQAFDERVAANEQPAVREGTDKELSALTPDEADPQLVDAEQGTALQEQPAEEEERTPEARQVAEVEQALTPQEEEVPADGQHVDVAEGRLAQVSSAWNPQDGNFDWSLEDPDTQLPAEDGWHVDIAESPQAPVSSPPSSEPDGLNWGWSLDDPPLKLRGSRGDWPLYVDEYPQAYVWPVRGAEDEEVDWDWDFDVGDSNQDVAHIATGEEADVSSDERPRTTGEHPVADGRAANGEGGNERSGNGQMSSGRECQRTGTPSRSRRSRLK